MTNMLVDVRHGTQWYYRQGCRCGECRAAHAADAKKYRAAHLEQVRAWQRAYRAEHVEIARTRDRVRYQEPQRRAATKAAATQSYERNREARIQSATEWNKANPARRRTTHLKTKYGITDAEYEAMRVAQNGRCGICTDTAQLVVDHDHETGRVRGLLCRKCNAAIGGLQDSPALLRRALAWLEDN